MTTLWDIRKMAIESLDEYFPLEECQECKDLDDDGQDLCWECNGLGQVRDFGQYPEDSIHEIADSSVPVYTSDLMQLAADNLDMATLTPELGPAFDGSATPANIVAANVYEYLIQELHEALHELQTA